MYQHDLHKRLHFLNTKNFGITKIEILLFVLCIFQRKINEFNSLMKIWLHNISLHLLDAEDAL